MADFKIGGTTPRTIIAGMNPKTGIPAPVKDIYYGSEWIWTAYSPDIVMMYNRPGTWYYPLPDYEAEVDVYAFGGGGGGQVGHGGNNTAGKGGLAGSNTSQTLKGIRGGEMKIVVGAGGAGGNPGAGNGGESTVGIGWQVVRASGGQGGAASGQGGSSYGVDYERFGHTHPIETGGHADGGRGGNGGYLGSFTDGLPGGPGYVWVRIRKVMPY